MFEGEGVCSERGSVGWGAVLTGRPVRSNTFHSDALMLFALFALSTSAPAVKSTCKLLVSQGLGTRLYSQSLRSSPAHTWHFKKCAFHLNMSMMKAVSY